MTAKRPIRKGTSFVEVLIAMFVLAVSAIGASYFFGYGRGQIRQGSSYRMAMQLAQESLEAYKALPFADLADGTYNEPNTVQGQAFNRVVVISSVGEEPYKQAQVTVSWGNATPPRQVDLTTFLSPNAP